MTYLTNPISHNLISVPVLTNALVRNLISAFGHIDPLGCRLILALVFTSHRKCHLIILLLILCLAVALFNSPRLFLLSISLIFCSMNPLLEYTHTRMKIKLRCKCTEAPHSELTLNSSHAHVDCNLINFFLNGIVSATSCFVLVYTGGTHCGI